MGRVVRPLPEVLCAPCALRTSIAVNEPSTELPTTAIYAQPWAVRIGAVLLCAFAAIVALAFFDNAQRAMLETVAETTAVGDTAYFHLPEAAKLPMVVAKLEGRPLSLADVNPIDLRETHTRRVGEDASAGVKIYALSAAATASERQRAGGGTSVSLLKAGVNQFFVVQPSPAK
jgi:hypothetical protein